MGTTLLSIGKRFVVDEAGLRASLVNPVLLWEGQAIPGGGDTNTRADVNTPVNRATVQALVFELKKDPVGGVGFPGGITVGRITRNDIVLDDISVSRFHAYFQRDAKSGQWRLADAGSRFGTWIASKRLSPNEPARVTNHDFLRFGNVEVMFLTPEALLERLRQDATSTRER